MSGAEPLPPLRSGEKRAYRQCACGQVGWYDYQPFSLSAPILAFPCGHDAKAARHISEAEFLAAIAPAADERSLAEWIVANWSNQDLAHSDFRVEAFERARSIMLTSRSGADLFAHIEGERA